MVHGTSNNCVLSDPIANSDHLHMDFKIKLFFHFIIIIIIGFKEY